MARWTEKECLAHTHIVLSIMNRAIKAIIKPMTEPRQTKHHNNMKPIKKRTTEQEEEDDESSVR